MTSMGEREIGAISGDSQIIWESWHICVALDLSHDLHKSCMYDQCKSNALLQLFICFVSLTLGSGLKKSPI